MNRCTQRLDEATAEAREVPMRTTVLVSWPLWCGAALDGRLLQLCDGGRVLLLPTLDQPAGTSIALRHPDHDRTAARRMGYTPAVSRLIAANSLREAARQRLSA